MIVTVEPPFCGVTLDCAAGALVELLADGVPELPQAAISAAAPATSGAAHHRLRIGYISVLVGLSPSPLDYVAPARIVHLGSGSCICSHSQASDKGYR
jgi:hypothetical protein